MGEPVFFASNRVTGQSLRFSGSSGEIACVLPRLPLLEGRYSLTVHVSINGVVADWVRNAVYFDVFDADVFGSGNLPPTTHGRVLVDQRWDMDPDGGEAASSRSAAACGGAFRLLAFRLRESSLRERPAANTRDAFDRLYRLPELMREYLGPERLAFYDEVAARCSAKARSKSVIDVGCGSGHLLAALLDRVSPRPLTTIGVDDAPQAIVRLTEVVPGARGIVASIYDLDKRLDQASFDLVLCTEVLEHLERPLEALEQLRRLRGPEGRLVVTVPDGEIDDYEGHVSFWSIDEFRMLLAHAGTATVDRLADGTLYGVVDG